MAWVRCCGGSTNKKYLIKDGVLQTTFTVRAGTVNVVNHSGSYCEFSAGATGAFDCLSLDKDITDISTLHAEYYMQNGDSDTLFGFITNYGSSNNKASVQSLINSTSATEGVTTKPAGALSIGVALDTRWTPAKMYIKNLWYE